MTWWEKGRKVMKSQNNAQKKMVISITRQMLNKNSSLKMKKCNSHFMSKLLRLDFTLLKYWHRSKFEKGGEIFNATPKIFYTESKKSVCWIFNYIFTKPTSHMQVYNTKSLKELLSQYFQLRCILFILLIFILLTLLQYLTVHITKSVT